MRTHIPDQRTVAERQTVLITRIYGCSLMLNALLLCAAVALVAVFAARGPSYVLATNDVHPSLLSPLRFKDVEDLVIGSRPSAAKNVREGAVDEKGLLLEAASIRKINEAMAENRKIMREAPANVRKMKISDRDIVPKD